MSPVPSLRVLDCFAGIGGFSLGLERTGGFRTVGFVENDPFCQRVLAKHWPDVPLHGDIRTRAFIEDEADVVTGGFPCQDISLAGSGAGLAGERSGLWRELVRAIRLVRPRYAIVENVAALLGRGLDVVLGDLAEIGYDAEWHCIPAAAVGAPHRRDRVWIVAADAHGYGLWPKQEPIAGRLGAALARPDGAPWPVADAYCDGQQQSGGAVGEFGGRIGNGSQPMADAGQGFAFRRWPQPKGADWRFAGRGSATAGWWAAEPDVGRVAHGVPSRVDRLRPLGNAIVPQVAELIGRALLSARGGA